MEPIVNRAERNKSNFRGITGSTLKIIAIISMLVDHTGAIVLQRMLYQTGAQYMLDSEAYRIFLEAQGELYAVYMTLRMIGRIAFPIFCFLLVEGFVHTHDLKKYVSRLALFALISEMPFDLAFSGRFVYWGYQNVYFTLLFGILAIAGIRMAQEKREWNLVGRVLFGILAVGLCVGAAMLLQTDYSMLGVLAIVVLYLCRRKKTLSVGLSCLVLLEIPALFSMIPVYLYNGERGRKMKWIFYIFYPLHILLLYLLACALGLGSVLMR